MTYGWAILVVLVVIAAMGYFGVLDPSNVVPDRCYLGEKFSCDDFRFEKVGDNGRVYLSLTNALTQPIFLGGINVSTPSGDCFNSSTGYFPALVTLKPGETFTTDPFITCNTAINAIKLRTKFKFKVSINYTLPDSSIRASRIDSGEILTKIER